ncbi:GntR family transcriptional regulator [Intrasporangium calvum]|uniref:Transcriptional regulator, GntR family n=1 Tax=Intrasporangium calvum (strain ATCC 23552 / DSM 43043 / JCM 3097 / NBRC 12989 / NCIMB 10167 / NRRL B-3866 / 7 KIP) TaxID=710696 RepID=E6SAS1_INTC7|nr:GntR family transcriptional regulator [Intrasporangium calvum]ADU48344.1 transcriptional regulator, GntR family [Intrasporangium calvum DSM 43043]AXG13381.1 GntR family transcriptional regulator [Intrasporangium calvum]
MSDSPPAVEHDPSHASDHAYRLIRAQILSGERQGGDWLREGDLAESVGVSRTPVREALRRLTAEGLVSYERNRGVQVAAWTAEDLNEIFSLRSLLEPWACRLAATAATVDLDELDRLAHDMDAAARGSVADVDRITELNNRFHRLILEGSNNRRLGSVVSSVVQVPLVWQTFSHYSDTDLRRSLAHHHELVSALAAADGDWAESVMRSHVRAAWNSLHTEDDSKS